MQYPNRLLVPVSPAMHRAVQAEAARRGISLSEFVRQAIAAELPADAALIFEVSAVTDDGADMPTE